MLNYQKMWIYDYWNAVSVSHTVALLPVTPPSMIPPPVMWRRYDTWCRYGSCKCEDVSGVQRLLTTELECVQGHQLFSVDLYNPDTKNDRDAVWKVTEKSLGFFTCSIPSLFGTAVVGNNPKTEILSESIYIISDDAVLKMIRYTDTCRLLSLCLSQPVKQCRVMNNNAGKLFHYRITVSPPTNFLVSLFFLLRTLK